MFTIDKDITILFLGTVITILAYFIRGLISRLDKVESRVNMMLSTQLSHGKDIDAFKDIVKELKEGFKDQERKREEFLAQIPARFNEAMGAKLSEVIMEIRLIQHRVGIIEDEKKH